MKLKFLYSLIIVVLFLICTGEQCTLEQEIRLDSDFVKVESRLDPTFLLKNKSEYCLYVVGVSNEFQSQLAVDTATARGRGSLSKQVKDNVARVVSDYLTTKANCSADNEHFAPVVDNITEQIYNLALYKSDIERVYEDKASDPHTFFVVVKFDLNIITKNIESIVADSIEHYIKLGPSKSMFDFKAEIMSWTANSFEMQEEVVK